MALMTLKEVSQYLHVGYEIVRRLAHEDRIPCMKVGRLWRFDKEKVDKWMNEGGDRGSRR